MKPLHNFTRATVCEARSKLKQGESHWRFAEPIPIEWKPTTAVAMVNIPVWTADVLIATDHEQLQLLLIQFCHITKLIDELGGCCPPCGGRELDFGKIVGPLTKLMFGKKLALRHATHCPLFNAWYDATRILYGQQEADKLNRLQV